MRGSTDDLVTADERGIMQETTVRDDEDVTDIQDRDSVGGVDEGDEEAVGGDDEGDEPDTVGGDDDDSGDNES